MIIYAVMKTHDEATYGYDEIVHLFLEKDSAEYVCDMLQELGYNNIRIHEYNALPGEKTKVLDQLICNLVDHGWV